MSPTQKVVFAACRGVAVWAAGDKLGWVAVGEPIPESGLAWLKSNNVHLLNILQPGKQGRLEREIRAGLGPGWLELYRSERDRLKTECPETVPRELKIRSWTGRCWGIP